MSQKIVPNLWFESEAEEAVNYYTSVFPDGKITNISRYGEGGPLPAGTVLTVDFELFGQEFTAINGGPHDKPNDAVSLLVNCDTQKEVDELWTKLTADGGRPVQCGWLKDRYGFSWQIIPTLLGKLLSTEDSTKANAVMQAMLQMVKIESDELQRAYDNA